ncbi:MAG TPA: response regulator [Burkholderiales bacterium]|nr:response regulator [Burkholderiales bacterium]
MTQPTVFVVDDDPAVLNSTLRLLKAEGLNVEAFESAEDFLARRDSAATGCLLLDVMMPGLDGLALQERLKESGRPMPIVFLTGEGDIPTSVRAIKAGAADFLTKPAAAEALLAAIRHALDESTSGQYDRTETAAIEQRYTSLTQREREVLEAIAAGKLNKQIAADLGIVEQTVKFHRSHIMSRMQAHSAAELMYMAAKLGLAKKPGNRSGD